MTRDNTIFGLFNGSGMVFEDTNKKTIGQAVLICTSKAKDKYKFAVVEFRHKKARVVVIITPTKIESSRVENVEEQA